MDGSAELRQLAHLLRVGASTAREIAALRELDRSEIFALARQADTIAEDLFKIAGSPSGDECLPLARMT